MIENPPTLTPELLNSAVAKMNNPQIMDVYMPLYGLAIGYACL